MSVSNMAVHETRAFIAEKDAREARRQPVYFVTVHVFNRLMPIAFFPKRQSEMLNTTSTAEIGVTLQHCKGPTQAWNVLIGRHMARVDYNEGMNQFMRAVLGVDCVSYAMSHQREVDDEFVHNKYGFRVPPLESIEPWTPPAVPRLNWKSCDCGCGCEGLMFGSMQFSYDKLGNLRIGHGTVGRSLGAYRTLAELTPVILRETRDERASMLKALRSTGDIQ